MVKHVVEGSLPIATIDRVTLMHKLGLQTQTDMVRYSLRCGVIQIDP